MRARTLMPLSIAVAVLVPIAALAHGRNEVNINNPGRAQATNGNFRRAAVLKAAGAAEYAWVRPLARAIAFSAKDQTAILNRISAYRKAGEEIALVTLANSTGKVAVVAIPKNKKVAPRVMSNREIRKLGIAPQSDVVPNLLSKVRGREVGALPAKSIRPSSLSTSGLSYQGVGAAPAKSNPSDIMKATISVPVTTRNGNLSGASFSAY